MLMKSKPIRSQKLRDSAKGEECTFQFPGVCNGYSETTVLCHLPDESKGGSRKADDISCAYGCSNCHDLVDGRHYGKLKERIDFEWYTRRAMVRTWRRMIEKGLIKIG